MTTPLLTNHQEMFDAAARGLASHYPKRAGDGARCSYRGWNNTKCGVGHLIPDDVYETNMDVGDAGIRTLIGFDQRGFLQAWKGKEDFLVELQMAHDDADWDFSGAVSNETVFARQPWQHGGLAQGLSSVAVNWSLDTAVLREVFSQEKSA